MTRSGENLELLRDSYDALVKSGSDSLSKAYVFGQVVRALHRFHTYKEMGEWIGRSASLIAIYAQLAGRYPTEQALLREADRIGSYDVSRLARDLAPAAPYHVVYHCTVCGSYDVVKERQLLEAVPA